MAKRKISKARHKKKLPWTGFEITRVKLNPEQAVLSCCNAVAKGESAGGWQCIWGVCDVINPTNYSSS